MSLHIKPITVADACSESLCSTWLTVCSRIALVIIDGMMNSYRMDSVNRPQSSVVLQAAASTSSTTRDAWATATRADGVGRSAVGSTTAGTCRRKREPLLGLIVGALREAGSRGLVLSSIYRYVVEHSPDYREADSSGAGTTRAAWRKNVRHILSVRNFFIKTAELNPDGRGRFWRLDEAKYAEFIAERYETTETRDKRPVSDALITITIAVVMMTITNDHAINR